MKLYGVAAEFSSAEELLRVARKMREAGYRHCDVFSPFPVHGMNEALGLRQSSLGKWVFVGGLLGFVGAAALVFVPSAVLYPLVVGGRTGGIESTPGYVAVLFELTILASAITAFCGLLLLGGLPRWHHPMLGWERFKAVSADKFFAVVEVRDPLFSEEAVRGFFEAEGAAVTTPIYEEEEAA